MKRKSRKFQWIIIYHGLRSSVATMDSNAVWNTRKAAEQACTEKQAAEGSYEAVKYVRADK